MLSKIKKTINSNFFLKSLMASTVLYTSIRGITFEANAREYNNKNNKLNISEKRKYINNQDNFDNLTELKSPNENKVLIAVIDDKNHGKLVSKIVSGEIEGSNMENNIDFMFLPKLLDFQVRDSVHANEILKYNKSSMIGNIFSDNIGKAQEILNNDLQTYEIIEKIGQKYKNKDIHLNTSFSRNYEEELKNMDFIGDSNPLKSDIFNDMKDNTQKFNKLVLNKLKENPNVSIYIAGGNNHKIHSGVEANLREWVHSGMNNIKDSISEMYFDITNGDYNKMIELSKLMEKVILDNDNFNENSINNIKLKINEISVLDEDYIDNNKIKEFVNLSIKDYLIHYDNVDLINNLDNSNNNELKDRISIVQSISHATLNRNYINYITTSEKELPENLESFLSNINQSRNYGSKEDMSKLNQLIEKYSLKYPEIFKITSYGSMTMLHKNNNIDISPEGFSIDGEKHNGTSFSTPYEMVKKIKIKHKDILPKIDSQKEYRKIEPYNILNN